MSDQENLQNNIEFNGIQLNEKMNKQQFLQANNNYLHDDTQPSKMNEIIIIKQNNDFLAQPSQNIQNYFQQGPILSSKQQNFGNQLSSYNNKSQQNLVDFQLNKGEENQSFQPYFSEDHTQSQKNQHENNHLNVQNPLNILSQHSTQLEYDKNINYYSEFWKVYLTNEYIIVKMKDLVNEIKGLKQRIISQEMVEQNIKKQQDMVINIESQIQNTNDQKQKKKNRRTAQEINKDHKCPYQNCDKSYGSDVSLNLHIKIKHGGGNKTEREKLARTIYNAQQNGEQIPDINLNLPPGYLELQQIKSYQEKKGKKKNQSSMNNRSNNNAVIVDGSINNSISQYNQDNLDDFETDDLNQKLEQYQQKKEDFSLDQFQQNERQLQIVEPQEPKQKTITGGDFHEELDQNTDKGGENNPSSDQKNKQQSSDLFSALNQKFVLGEQYLEQSGGQLSQFKPEGNNLQQQQFYQQQQQQYNQSQFQQQQQQQFEQDFHQQQQNYFQQHLQQGQPLLPQGFQPEMFNNAEELEQNLHQYQQMGESSILN